MKKRVLFVVVALLACITSVSAYDFEIDGIYYNKVDDENVAVTRRDTYAAYFGKVVIPSSVEYEGRKYTVNSIGDAAFMMCMDVTAVTLPNSITQIGTFAFYGCGLTSIIVPGGVTDIAELTFYQCSNLASVTLPERMTSIGRSAFCLCGSLRTINLPDGLTEIANTTFAECLSLASITIPNSVIRIGDGAFQGCKSLSSILIPEGITHIGEYAFSSCSRLTSVVIPEGITCIENGTFSNCSQLTSVIIPESVSSIGENAFSSCTNLSSITIPTRVTSIGDKAFTECRNLKDFFIPKNVTSIGYRALPDVWLVSVTVEEGNLVYDSRDNCNAVIETASNTLLVASRSTFIPEGVEHIGNEAFKRYPLTSIVIPNSVITIGDEAFMQCSFLSSFTMSEGTKSIGNRAFEYCSRLTSLTIPNSVTEIGDNAFSESGIKTITLPQKMSGMGNRVFYECVDLESVAIPEGIVMIGDYLFKSCVNLVSVTIPESVASIGSFAFQNCSQLSSIIIPKGVIIIKSDAFFGCSKLSDITCLATTPPIRDMSGFGEFATQGTLHVPSGCREAYASAEGWKDFNIIEDAGAMVPVVRGERTLDSKEYTDDAEYSNCFIFSLQDSVLSINGYYASNPQYKTRLNYVIREHDIFLNLLTDFDEKLHDDIELQPLVLDVSIEGCTEDYYYIYLSGYYGKTAIVDDYTLHETSFKGYGVRGFVREKPPKTDISTGQKDPNEKSDVDVVCRVRGMVGGHYQQHVSSIEGNVIYIDGTYSSQAEGDEDVEATTPLGQLPAGDYTIVINVKDMDDVMPPFSATLTFKVTPTGVEVTSADGAGDVIFNLQGHRVSHATEGVYIKNGKKIIIQ